MPSPTRFTEIFLPLTPLTRGVSIKWMRGVDSGCIIEIF